MALAITLIITFLFGMILIFIYGKVNIKKIIAPLLILLIGDFLFLYAKFVAGDSFLTLLLYLPAMGLLIISVIWFIIFLIVGIRRKYNWNKILAIFLSLAISAIILFLPALTQEDKYKLYREDYFYVSDAIFQAYDEGKISIKDQYQSPRNNTLDLDKLESLYSENVINKMRKLNRNAGVYTYILADEDVIYFSFGAFFQSISGIAITRNGKDPSTDDALKSRFFDGATSYRYIEDNVYYFFDGL